MLTTCARLRGLTIADSWSEVRLIDRSIELQGDGGHVHVQSMHNQQRGYDGRFTGAPSFVCVFRRWLRRVCAVRHVPELLVRLLHLAAEVLMRRPAMIVAHVVPVVQHSIE